MVKYRFEGSLSKKAKRSPLLVEIVQEALSATSSKKGRERVYARLDQVASQASIDTWLTFYLSLDEEFDDIGVKNNYDSESVNRGRLLAERLRDAVILPRKDHPKHDSKYLQQRHNEYGTILDFINQRKRGDHDG